MKLAIDTLQNILLPKLEKDPSFDADKTNIAFWESLSRILLDFEKDAKPLYTAIYNLELNDPEKIISKFSNVYSSYIKELAEYHVLGTSSKAIDYLLDSKNESFEKEVQFFSDLEKAIKKSERKRIKETLPTAYEKLSFELSETDIELAIKKKGREELKVKMKAWDSELASEVIPVISMLKEPADGEIEPVARRTRTGVIQLSWLKYAVAACLVLGFGIWFYQNQMPDIVPGNTVVTTPDQNQPSIKTSTVPAIPTEALAEVSTVAKASDVIEDNNGVGIASNSQKINVIENNQGARKLSIEKAIEKYRMHLQKEFPNHKVGSDSYEKDLQKTIDSLKMELKLLKEREKQYIFDGKKLTLFVSAVSKENRILLYDEAYYLNKGDDFYKLLVSKEPQLYIKENDNSVLKSLNKILLENGF